MSLAIQPETPPLRVDEDGAVRVGNTRVLFVLVARAFEDGASPEQIAQDYPSLSLEAYGAIAYYLRHRAEGREMIASYERAGSELRARVGAAQRDLLGIRGRLLARREALGL
jgi:uncharacterized protein (DUF433 family)